MKSITLAITLFAAIPALAQETPISVGARTCAESAAKSISFSNPESVRIGEPSGGAVEIISYHNQKVPARRFVLKANGRNMVCVTSEDGRRILQIS